MSLYLLKRYALNSRVRCFNVRAQTWHNGWVYDMTLPHLSVATTTRLESQAVHVLMIQGERSILNCAAYSVGIDQEESKLRGRGTILGDGPSLVGRARSCFHFDVQSEVVSKPSKMAMRKAVSPKEAILRSARSKLPIAIHDISVAGLGIISPQPVAEGELVELTIDDQIRSFSIFAEVKHCRSFSVRSNTHFVGLSLSGNDRLSVAKWKAFFDQESAKPARSVAMGGTATLEPIEEEEVLAEAKIEILQPTLEALGLHVQSLQQRIARVTRIERRIILRETRRMCTFGEEALEDSLLQLDQKLIKLRQYETALEASLYEAMDQLHRYDEKAKPGRLATATKPNLRVAA